MSPKRGGLGQGASALFQPSELLSGTGEGVSTLRLSEIEPDKGQPRKNFEPQALNDLADSIAAHGVLQPIVVRPARGGYVIVAGERRWRAARLAGLKEIVPVIRDRQTREIVENTIRKLDAIPEPECRRFIADTKQRFIQNRDNSIRRRLAEAKAQARTKKPHPKRKEPDRERS